MGVMSERESYKVLISNGTGEIVEKKSRFIGNAFAVENQQQAEEKIAEILYDERGGRVPKYNCKVYAKQLSKELLKLANKVLKEKHKV